MCGIEVEHRVGPDGFKAEVAGDVVRIEDLDEGVEAHESFSNADPCN